MIVRCYHHLCKCYGRDKVNTWRIIAEKEKDKKDKSKDKYIDKPIEKKALGKIANNLLLLAGYDFGQQNCNSSTDAHANTALKVLTDNYYRMLVTRAGLANDADTRSFLQGTVLRSSTYTNYESHTSPEAQYRLYKILLPVSSEKKINPPSIKDKSTFAATPKTNHEVAQIIGKIRLKPGEGITIEVPSGVTGTIEANDFDGAKTFVNINKDDCAT